jgi:hypothetical protein
MDEFQSNSSLLRMKTHQEDQIVNDDYVNIIFDEHSEVFNHYDTNEHKKEYYKSNPLRNYAPTKGQSMLPPAHSSNSATAAAASKRKNNLPNILKELRDQSMENFKQIEIDRTLYKYKLKGDLKVSLSSLDNTFNNSKIKINGLRESSSRKPYDYLRSSISKQNESRYQMSSNKPSTSDTIATQASFIVETPEKKFMSQSETTFNKQTRQQYNQHLAPVSALAPPPPGIDAQKVRINTLDEIVDEIKSKNKYKSEFIASMNKFSDEKNENSKYFIHDNNLNYDSFLNNITCSMNEIDLQANIGSSMYAYKNQTTQQSAKRIDIPPKVPVIKEPILFNEPSYTHFGSVIGVRHSNNNEHNSTFSQRKVSTAPKPSKLTERMSYPNEFYKHDELHIQLDPNTHSLDNFNCQIMTDDGELSANRKNKKRVRESRKKVVHNPVEKQNLNKITIIQPFEETKILINLDKVPTKVLNKMFNRKEDSLAKSYIIPPVKAFGFLTKKVSDSGASSISSTNLTSNDKKLQKQKKKINKKNELFNDASQNSFIIAKYVPPEFIAAEKTQNKVNTKKLESEAISTQ